MSDEPTQATPPPAQKKPPRVLGGRYEIGHLVGRGGMADVHEGTDLRLGRRVAIKILRTDLARDSSFLARFRREAQSAAGLNHPNIVAVYDTGEELDARLFTPKYRQHPFHSQRIAATEEVHPSLAGRQQLSRGQHLFQTPGDRRAGIDELHVRRDQLR